MATVIDELLVSLGFDADPTGADKFSASLSNVLGTITKAGAAMTAVGTVAGGFLSKALLSTASQFEQFETQLTTIEGSSEAARKSLDWISDFGARTPYDVAQVTEAFVKLKSYGLDPINNNLLESLGNTASAMGKPLEQAVEAIADAVRGENERLKEFGIIGSKNGNTMTYTYDYNGESLEKVVDNDTASMQAALQEIFDEKFAGGMVSMSKTWEGMLSNMGDTWTAFKKKVTDKGIFDRFKYALRNVLDLLERNKAAVDAFADRVGDKLVAAFDWLEESMWYLWDGALYVKDAFDILDDRFKIVERSGILLAGVLALITANLIGLAASKALATLISLGRGLALLFSPLALIGVAILLVAVAIEDIYGFLNGKDSLIGQLIKDYPIMGSIVDTIFEIVAALKRIWTDNQATFNELWNAIGLLYESFKPIIDILKIVIPELFSFMAEAALIAVNVISVGIKALAKFVTGAINGIRWVFEALFGNMDDGFTNFFARFKNAMIGIKDLVSDVVNVASALLDGEFKKAFTMTGTAVTKFYDNTLDEEKVVKRIAQRKIDQENVKSKSGQIAYSNTRSAYHTVNQAPITQTIHVANPSQAAIVANRTAQGARNLTNGYQ